MAKNDGEGWHEIYGQALHIKQYIKCLQRQERRSSFPGQLIYSTLGDDSRVSIMTDTSRYDRAMMLDVFEVTILMSMTVLGNE